MQRQHTVIFVRHEGSQLRKWRVSTWQVLATALGLVTLLTLSLVTTWSFFTSRVDGMELARLKDENEKLRLTNQSFESRLQSLHDDLAASEDRTRQLAIVAGLANLGATAEGGVGGHNPSGEGTDPLAIADLEARVGRLAHSLDRVEVRLGDNLKLISSTPAVWPVRGLLSSSFGYRRDPITGQRAFHSGVDISAQPGKPVRATAAGVVVRTEEYGGLGRSVFVAHGYGVTTVYGHLARIQVSPGQRVDRGDLVGLVGNTGRATGYHLHYEVQLEGKAVNPLAYMLDGGLGES